MIKSIKKTELKHLNDVFTYRNRTVALKFIVAVTELNKHWEKYQLELAVAYQYESQDQNIWDYYLVFLCAFDEKSIDPELKFKIESDRFCCRKIFIFGQEQKNYKNPELVCHVLFPEIEKTKDIQVIQPQSLIKKLKSNLKNHIGQEFFTKELDEKAVEVILKKLIKKGESDE